MPASMNLDTLLEHFQSGERVALSRVISLVEQGELSGEPAEYLGENLRKEKRLRTSTVVGITGSGGAGKSTLIGVLVAHLRETKHRVAVLACDPASPVSGGALLGDRIRLPLDPNDDGIYFRSLSTRGAYGGIAAAVEKIIPWLVTFGFDTILIETVGVGQDQVAVQSMVDALVLLVTPNTGDEIQWEKAGLIELADVVVVNKQDIAGSERVKAQLANALSLSPAEETPPIVMTSATQNKGIGELWQTIIESID